MAAGGTGGAEDAGVKASPDPKLNRKHRREIEATVRRIEKIETALEPNFQQLFVNAMALPNKVDAFPKLAAVVKLPARKAAAEDAGGDGRPPRRSPEERAARRRG